MVECLNLEKNLEFIIGKLIELHFYNLIGQKLFEFDSFERPYSTP